VAQAEALAGDEERLAIAAALGNAQATDDAVRTAIQALVSCGARQACEERAVLLVEGALHALKSETFRQEGRQLLADLTCFLAGRDT
jgi:geranylgeranyl pyrophosphate synthase